MWKGTKGRKQGRRGERYSPYGLEKFLGTGSFGFVLFPASHKQMLVLGLATLNLHEFVKFQDPSLATAVAFASLVEDGNTGVVNAGLRFASLCALFVRCAARASSTYPSVGNLE